MAKSKIKKKKITPQKIRSRKKPVKAREVILVRKKFKVKIKSKKGAVKSLKVANTKKASKKIRLKIKERAKKKSINPKGKIKAVKKVKRRVELAVKKAIGDKRQVTSKTKVRVKQRVLKDKRPRSKVIKKINRKELKKIKVFEVVKDPVINSSKPPVSLLESFKPKIKVIGVGGGGGSIVSEIGRSLDKATFVIADTDVRALKRRKGIKYFIFGHDLTHGLGTGLNVDLAKEAAQREREKIIDLFEGQDIVIFITCLGGGLGSGATQVFLDTAKNFKGIILGIFTLPFRFEGKSKQKIAMKALRDLRKSLSVSITIPNERIFKIIDENTPIVEAFSMVNKSLIESLESLIDLIQSPGLINIDFADLRAILQGRGNLAFLNTAESSGKDKADNVIKNVLHNPLYQDNFVPEKVLFNIEGGKNLSMFEVDKISKAISDKNQKAKIIFGISKNPKYKNKIKTTLLMTGPSLSDDVQVEKPHVSLDKTIKKEKTSKKPGGKNKSNIKAKNTGEENVPTLENLIPAFANLQAENQDAKRIIIDEKSQSQKRAIRRTALEIQRAEEIEKNKKSKQEEEWEIPAFLRFKKVK